MIRTLLESLCMEMIKVGKGGLMPNEVRAGWRRYFRKLSNVRQPSPGTNRALPGDLVAGVRGGSTSVGDQTSVTAELKLPRHQEVRSRAINEVLMGRIMERIKNKV